MIIDKFLSEAGLSEAGLSLFQANHPPQRPSIPLINLEKKS